MQMAMQALEVFADYPLPAYRGDVPYLVLGLALLTLALVAAGVATVRRERTPLLWYFAVFAALYGLRLCLQRGLVQDLFAGGEAYHRFTTALDYLIPIPGLLFFRQAGWLRRLNNFAIAIVGFIGSALFALTLGRGEQNAFHLINNALVIITTLVFGWDFLRVRERSADYRTTRAGIVAFGVLVLYDNIGGGLQLGLPSLEPLGFAFLLGCMGTVAARRAVSREQKLAALESELEVARRIQLSILPGAFPAGTCFDVASVYLPMTSVAGDFYDYVLAERSKAGILVADVSGHGVPAALIASMVKLAAAAQRDVAAEPAKVLAGMNATLLGNTQNQFVTAAYLYVDAEEGELRYSAAAHPAMLLVRNGKAEWIEQNGLMLAAFDFAGYETRTLPLASGDRLVLYTDGVLEATNAGGEFFGAERLAEEVTRLGDLNAVACARAMAAAVQRWSAAQDDDITIIVCDRK